MKKILVTGGAGFIGSHTVELLLANNAQVCVYDNFSSGKKENLSSHPNLKIIEADILDFASLKKAITQSDAVLHLAAIASVSESIENPVRTLQTNTQGFVQVLEAIRNANNNVRLVYASSAAVYGDTKDLPCNDEVRLQSQPLSPYALEKINTEKYADLYLQLFNVKSLGLRYFNVYGPKQDPNSFYAGVIAKFIANVKENKKIKIFGDGLQSRDFIAVQDVARANLIALQSDYAGVMNIATGKAETLKSLLSYIEKATNENISCEYHDARLGDIHESYASTNKAKQKINFQAEISLQQGIAALLC